MRVRRMIHTMIARPFVILTAALVLAACVTAPNYQAASFAGRWEVEIQSELGPIEQNWEVDEERNGRITNLLDGSQLDMFNIRVDRRTVTFDAIFAIDDQSVPVQFQGTISDQTIVGEFISEFGNAQVRGLRR
jgi:hypothetical protein